MADPTTWQSAFVATTYAIGDSVGDAQAALSPADQSLASAVVKGLAHAQREVRARTLAAALGRIVADVELARIA
jgi:hypothetical protein